MDFELIVNWLGREGGDLLRWWLLVTLAGAAAWPLLYRILGGLPDRGYTLARPAGLMLTGFIFWFLGSLGLLENTPGGMAFAWLVVLVIGLVAFLRWENRPPVREWFSENLALIVLTEVLFALLFVGWATVRAHNPEIYSTEKPMEIMFINGIRTSRAFPPHDSWLAGYAISYYYFGYVLIAMLADLSGLSTGIAFNLAIALIFALTGTGVLGVVYNMVRARSARVRGGSIPAALAAGVLALCFLIFMGNLGTALIEFPYQGYTPGLVNASYFNFWDVEGREGTQTIQLADGETARVPADSNGNGIPNWEDTPLPFDRWEFTRGMGWRYSRIVQDRDLQGNPIGIQPITEFPDFSFTLADIHPHVLALPFAVLALGLALNLVLNGRDLFRWEYPLYAIWVGGMIFVNSWDAVYLPLLVGAEALRRLIRNGSGSLSRADVWGIARFALIIGGLTLVFYLPWLISFTSQANGILPNLIYPTAWQQYFLQFGTFLVILTVFVLVEVRRAGDRLNGTASLLVLVAGVVTIVLMLVLLGWIAWNRNDVRSAVYSISSQPGGLGSLVDDVLKRRLIGLPSEMLMIGLIVLVIGRLFARMPFRLIVEADISEREIGPDNVIRVRAINYSPATGFALLLVGAAAVLTIAPDFVYLRDNFAVRINTVFKLYYQGWIIFSIASAFAVWSVLAGQEPAFQLNSLMPGRRPAPNAGDQRSVGVGLALPWARRASPLRDDDKAKRDKPKRGRVLRPMNDPSLKILMRGAFGLVVVLFFAAGLLYPVFAIRARTMVDTGRISLEKQIEVCESDPSMSGSCPKLTPLTLDGAPTLVLGSPDEYSAIQCLSNLEQEPGDAVLLEAPCHCGYHPEIGRFSALTGIPTLMGWGNHEGQWRGDTLPEVIDTRVEDGQLRDRFTDAQEIYTTQDWDRVWSLIDRYGIDYIVVGNAERNMIRDLAGDDQSRLQSYQLGLQKFEQVLTPVCAAGNTTVYRVKPQ
jgi:YYY domain-containing protein